MTNYVYVFESMDGYISGKEKNLDWIEKINSSAEDNYGFNTFVEKIDVIVMGENTFLEVLEFGSWFYDKPVCVLSENENIVPDNLTNKAFCMSGEVMDIYNKLKDQGFNNIQFDGVTVIHSFLEKGLIDEMYLVKVPMLLGGGMSLFEDLEKQIHFKFAGSELYDGSIVKNHYIIKDMQPHTA